LKHQLITPQAIVYSADVYVVTLTGVEGQLDVFLQHVPQLTQMLPGELIVNIGGHTESLASGEGVIEVTADHVAILTDMAIAAEHIDEAAVEEARRRAEARLQEKLSDEEVASTNASLARALAQF